MSETVVVVVVAPGAVVVVQIHITLHIASQNASKVGAYVTKGDVGNESTSKKLLSSPHVMPIDEKIKKNVSQCPIIAMIQTKKEKPYLESRSSSRNKIHKVLKLEREFESKPKQRSTCQRKRTRLMRECHH